MCVWIFTVGCKGLCRELSLCAQSMQECLRTTPWLQLLLSPVLIIIGFLAVGLPGLCIVLIKFVPCLAQREVALWKEYAAVVRSGCRAYKEDEVRGGTSATTCCRQCSAELAVLGFPVLLLTMGLLLPIFTLLECLGEWIGAIVAGIAATCVEPFSLGRWWAAVLVALHSLDKASSLIAWSDPTRNLLCACATSEAALAAEREERERERQRQLDADRLMAEQIHRQQESNARAAQNAANVTSAVTHGAQTVASAVSQAQHFVGVFNRLLNPGAPQQRSAMPAAGSGARPAVVPGYTHYAQSGQSGVAPATPAVVIGQPATVPIVAATPIATPSVPSAAGGQGRAPLPRAVPVSRPSHAPGPNNV